MESKIMLLNKDENVYENIKESYKIGCTIGRGSFAKVKKCMNRKTGEKFALKIFSKRKMTTEELTAVK